MFSHLFRLFLHPSFQLLRSGTRAQKNTQEMNIPHSLLRDELRCSARMLSQMNITAAAKWSAEALNGLSPSPSTTTTSTTPTTKQTTTSNTQWLLFNAIDQQEKDLMILAQSYFDCKEFDRCSFVLKHASSPFAVFIRLYALYLSGDKRKEEDSEGVLGNNDSTVCNANVPIILKELMTIMQQQEMNENPFLLYLHGILLLRQKSAKLGIQALVKSIKIYPFNWSVWSELVLSMTSLEEALSILQDLTSSLGNDYCSSIMLRIAKVVINQEFFQQFDELHKEIASLIQLFPNFAFLQTQSALVSYHALEYQQAETTFDSILTSDPYCLDNMDTYSNILYVMEKRSKLSYLAQLSSQVDKFRPETCCIIANYYSLKFEHEKAIMYYRRALTLNKECLSAWTLMGHEFVECKNSHAAIESYRRAVDTNPKDFKAWYGLGQAYEVLDMHMYSLYYYQRASMLKPNDKRIWIALGECFLKLTKLKESIKCYNRALNLSEFVDLGILLKLAQLFETEGDFEKVYEHMTLIFNEHESKSDEVVKARLWLAKYELKMRNYHDAYAYAVDLTFGTSQEIEDARAIAREARNRMKS